MTLSARRKQPLPSDTREWLRSYVTEHGETAAVEFTGLARVTIARALAGLALHPGTRLAFEAARRKSAAEAA